MVSENLQMHIDAAEKKSMPVPEHPMELADLLVAYLEQMEIEYIFGIPGGAIEPLFNAMARSQRRGGLRFILARNEAGAAFMADGYARETGKIGVCCATSGPGSTNLITGVACAYDNNIPILVITAQPALPTFGKQPLQESACTGVNILGMLQHCTHYNSLISHPQQFEHKLITALQFAIRDSGPVHLSVPVDVFRALNTRSIPSYDLQALLRPSSLVDEEALATLSKMLIEAHHIVLLVGACCGEAIGSILQFAEICGALVVTTPDGKGLVNSHHPLFRGVFGFAGHALAEAVLSDQSVDLIMAIGTGMGEWNSGGWSDSLLNARLVHIDDSEAHLARTPMARFHMRGRILSIFNRLVHQMHSNRQIGKHKYERLLSARKPYGSRLVMDTLLAAPEKYESRVVPILPQRLMCELGHLFPPTTRFIADTGNSTAWAIHYLHLVADRRMGERRLGSGGIARAPGRRKSDGGWLRVVMNFAPMGWAIGAAIGTAAANPRVPVVCITGDGSFLMNGQEISVAVAEKQSVIFVVLNDRALGMVKHGQRLAGAEQIGCDLPATDFAALARAMGAVGHTIRTSEDLQNLDIAAMCTRRGPTLLDVLIDAREVPPMNVRMRVLANNCKE